MPINTSPESLSTSPLGYPCTVPFESFSTRQRCNLPTFWRVGLNWGLLVSSAWSDCPLQIPLLIDRSRLFRFADNFSSGRVWRKTKSTCRVLLPSVGFSGGIRCAWWFRLGKELETGLGRRKTEADRRQKTCPMHSNIRLSVYPLCLFSIVDTNSVQIAPTAEW